MAQWLPNKGGKYPEEQEREYIHVLIAWSKESVEAGQTSAKGASSLFNDKHSLFRDRSDQHRPQYQNFAPHISVLLNPITLYYFYLGFPLLPFVHHSHHRHSYHFTFHSAICSSTTRQLDTEKWSRACSPNRILEKQPALSSTIKQAN